jgi:hypothetical protein
MTALLWLFPIFTQADTIYLKDGTKVRAAKVWEEGDVIRFSLEDYEGIIITYSKEIVERIEKDKAPAETRPPKQDDTVSENQKSAATGETAKPPQGAAQSEKSAKADDQTEGGAGHAETTQPEKTGQSNTGIQTPMEQPRPNTAAKTEKPAQTAPSRANSQSSDQTLTKKVPAEGISYRQMDGILFYNPRRPYKYWTGPNARHHTLKEALAALAKQFDRDPQWVAEHLGKTNNLGDIYRNLGSSGGVAPSTVKSVASPRGFLFYDPRRPYKFWTGATSKHRTLKEALDVLAKQYDRSPDWVKAHMGESNDLGEIHKNLMATKAKEAKD